MAAARHQMGVGLMKKRRAGYQRDRRFHGVHQVEILFTGFCAGAHAQNSVFAMEINGDSFRQIAGDEIGNPPAEIYAVSVLQFERRALRNLFARQSMSGDAAGRHHLFRNAVTRHNGFLSPERCDERKSRGSRRVRDGWRRPERFLRLRRWWSWRPWP